MVSCVGENIFVFLHVTCICMVLLMMCFCCKVVKNECMYCVICGALALYINMLLWEVLQNVFFLERLNLYIY